MSGQTRIYNTVYGSPWRNCYWFARMLLSTDQYGAAGKNEAFMKLVLTELEPLVLLNTLSENDKYKICRDSLLELLEKFSVGKSKSAVQRRNLYDEIDREINSLDDIVVFLLTIKRIILPNNKSTDKSQEHETFPKKSH